MPGRGVLCAVLAALAAPATASADETITAAPFERYEQTEVTIDQGERVTFFNRDVSEHDVVGETFRSRIVGTNQSAPVEGAERLTSGRYAFACSLHPNMQGTLVVRGADGTPPPPPPEQPPAPADTTAPGLRVRLFRDGPRAVLVQVKVDEAASVEIRAGGVTRRRSTSGPKTFMSRFRARRNRTFRASVKAVDAAGNESSLTKRLRARR